MRTVAPMSAPASLRRRSKSHEPFSQVVVVRGCPNEKGGEGGRTGLLPIKLSCTSSIKERRQNQRSSSCPKEWRSQTGENEWTQAKKKAALRLRLQVGVKDDVQVGRGSQPQECASSKGGGLTAAERLMGGAVNGNTCRRWLLRN